MPTSNYFKVRDSLYFFFDNDSYESAFWAYDLAKMNAAFREQICIYKPIRTAGPWNGLPMVGEYSEHPSVGPIDGETTAEVTVQSATDGVFRQRKVVTDVS